MHLSVGFALCQAITLSLPLSHSHEVLDNTVEAATFVAVAMFIRRKSTEVLDSLWHHFAVQTDDNPTNWLSAVRDVKEDL